MSSTTNTHRSGRRASRKKASSPKVRGKKKLVRKVKAKTVDRKIASPIAESMPDFEKLMPLRTCLRNGDAHDAPALDDGTLRHMLEFMILNRELDERLTKLQRQGRIGFHIGSVGEEALMIGTAAAARPEDWVVPCYREMGVALYRGMSLDSILANMYGTREDPVKGRQMPCHYTDREHNFLSISSPVGTQITQAAGVGWAMRIRNAKAAALVYFGDGATSEGDFHTGMNFAGVYKAQVVFICRNNQWAISTPLSVQTASTTIAQKALAYGMPGERVDGNDVLAVYAATSEALERARRGEGPTLLEMVTYRVGAHSTSDDPRAYRQEDEVDPWKAKDPIARFRAYLSKRRLWSDEDDARIVQTITEGLQAAIARAESTPPPPLSSMFEDVFETPTPALAEQLREADAASHHG